MATDFGITSPSGWYKVLIKSILENGGSFVSGHYKGSLIKGLNNILLILTKGIALNTVYPEYHLQRYNPCTGSHGGRWYVSKSQVHLYETLQKLFKVPIIQNLRLNPKDFNASYPYKVRYFEMDVSLKAVV
jgi:hypothetical protein